jgi:hypothetical protein
MKIVFYKLAKWNLGAQEGKDNRKHLPRERRKEREERESL